MKLVIISFIVAIVMLVADHGKTEEFPAEKLDKILEDFDYDYRKEITESVFKPCLQHMAKKFYSTAKSLNMTGTELEEFVESSVALQAIQLRKGEPLIYNEVKDEDPKMREALYAVMVEQCRKRWQ